MRWLTTTFVRRASFTTAAGLAAALALQQFGCSSGSHPTGGTGNAPPGADQTGAVGMTLTIPGGEMLSAIGWVITGPNGASTIVQQGTVNVQSSASINFLVSGIPTGSGYTVSLSGTTTDGAFACSGSATFAVTARMTTNVTANVSCAVRAQDAGSVNVGGQVYSCATVNGISAMPSETAVGGTVALSASATAPNGGTLSYAWSAPSGSFSAPTAASTGFTCTTAGPVTVTVTVGDGPVPDGSACNPAQSSFTAQIQCDGVGQSVCALGPGGAIKHVIYVQFDNTHLSQDVSNVASDLQQMPHLLGFIRGNGTMMANDHTILISHTGGGILSTLTGMYPDRTGQTVSNSYVRTSATGSFSFPSTFQYWSDTVATNVYNLTQPDGTNVPAPWLPYTRSGCNFGAVGLADMELESVSTSAFGDVATVFGTTSPQFAEAKANASKAVTDLEGIAVHCAQGSSVCASGEADTLPATQNYAGFRGLFGTQQINPVLAGNDAGAALTDLLGNPIQDANGNPGFPGFNGMTPAVSLAYMAAMQESGIPVTFAYISDAHDNHGVDGSGQSAFGPGQPGYEQQLANYDQAFANFFTRLAADGINQSNTLFVFTVDEGDHFVGVAPSPPTCDGGAGNTCNYPDPGDAGTGLGEVNVNIDLLITSEQPALASNFVMGNRSNPAAPYDFTVHGDDAPTFYLSRVVAGDAGQPTGALAQGDPVTRQFERAAGGLTIQNPYTSNTDNLLFRMADQTGMQAIHMMAASDPARNPTFVYFANDDYFVTDFPTTTCADCANPAFAWNHGDDQSVIGQTWVGFVGPGVVNENGGPDQTIWTDHTDVRPTMLSILGLQDGYVHDGRVITQALQPAGYSPNLASNLTTVQTLGDAYKQINSPFDLFGQCVLTVSTAALQADDATYASLESSIATLTSQRDALAATIKNALAGAEFGAAPIATADASSWITQAQGLLSACSALQASVPPSGGSADAGAGGN
ncbi:MAG TPA: hypothetical protein VGM06_11275 [Polyangiaceae bacterium]|jgi:hypothetical protein